MIKGNLFVFCYNTAELKAMAGEKISKAREDTGTQFAKLNRRMRRYFLITNLCLLAFLLLYAIDTGRYEKGINALIAPFSYFYTLYDKATSGEKLLFWGGLLGGSLVGGIGFVANRLRAHR